MISRPCEADAGSPAWVFSIKNKESPPVQAKIRFRRQFPMLAPPLTQKQPAPTTAASLFQSSSKQLFSKKQRGMSLRRRGTADRWKPVPVDIPDGLALDVRWPVVIDYDVFERDFGA